MNHFPVSSELISEKETEMRIERMVDEWFAEAEHERTRSKRVALRKAESNSHRPKRLVLAYC